MPSTCTVNYTASELLSLWCHLHCKTLKMKVCTVLHNTINLLIGQLDKLDEHVWFQFTLKKLKHWKIKFFFMTWLNKHWKWEKNLNHSIICLFYWSFLHNSNCVCPVQNVRLQITEYKNFYLCVCTINRQMWCCSSDTVVFLQSFTARHCMIYNIWCMQTDSMWGKLCISAVHWLVYPASSLCYVMLRYRVLY